MSRSVALFLAAVSLAVAPVRPAAAQPEPFDAFLRQFCADGAFRLDRVAWPITAEYVRPDDDFATGSVEVDRDGADEWLNLTYEACFNGETTGQIYDNFELELRDTGRRAFEIRGNESGIYVVLFFERMGGEWFLVRLADYGV